MTDTKQEGVVVSTEDAHKLVRNIDSVCWSTIVSSVSHLHPDQQWLVAARAVNLLVARIHAPTLKWQLELMQRDLKGEL